MDQHDFRDMDQKAYRIAYLIAGYIRNTLTPKEHQELDDWVVENDHNMQLFEELTDQDNIEANLAWMDQVQSRKTFEVLQQSGAFNEQAKRVHFNPVWMAAATIIIVVLAVFLLFKNKRSNDGKEQPIAVSDSIRPGGNRAVLTLADGSVIDLDNQKIGSIVNTESSHVIKPADGELVYDQEHTGFSSLSFHTLSTPVGGQYQVTLPDGSKVWLNAATSIKYPTAFPSNERKIELEGEAYFEVSKNKDAPFIVQLADTTSVTVLGTHFNVMSYKTEGQKEITLLEGRVAVAKNKQQLLLKPGMQAAINHNEIMKKESVDTTQVTGWKNGLFVFHDAPIELIMRQVERWYGAKVVYKGRINQQFNATIYRKEPLSKLLHLLELNGYVHFQIQNKTVYVLP